MSLDALKQVLANRLPRRLVLLAGRHNRGRRAVARRYLSGTGVEIGALGQPLVVPRGVRVEYVDRISKAEAIRRFPVVGGAHLVDPTYIGDGFELDFLAAESRDFVIANHVLEHAPDPLAVLQNWTRVLKPGGVLFVTVPHVDDSFDRGRGATPLAHLVEDHRFSAAGQTQTFWDRSRQHYQEWVGISRVNAAGPGQPRPKAAETMQMVEQLLAAREEIHFHTFNEESYRLLLEHFAATGRPMLHLAEVIRNRTEVIGVLVKPISNTIESFVG